MKKFFIVNLFVLMSFSALPQQGSISPVTESRSKMSFTETRDSIKSISEANGWKVLIVHDLQASLKKNGQEVLPVSVIEICKPSYSGVVLKEDESRALSVLMPCRVSVYEKEDGEVYISRMNISALDNSSFSKESSGKMKQAADDIEIILKGIVQE